MEYLYHYTTIDKLALILKNKTIRLNSLDKMDDLQEQKTADVENVGKFIFISCWTSDKIESIPMWKLYTDPAAGIRIRMRKNPFRREGTKPSDIVRKTGIQWDPNQMPPAIIPTFLDLADMFDKGFYSYQAYGGDILSKVEYTDDLRKLEPCIIRRDNEGTTVDFGAMGKYKSSYWAFQKEWRYIMTFLKMDIKNKSVEALLKDFQNSIQKLIIGKEEPPINYYDLRIDDEAFQDFEITLSPQLLQGNRIIVDTLVKEFNPCAIIKESDLIGKI